MMRVENTVKRLGLYDYPGNAEEWCLAAAFALFFCSNPVVSLAQAVSSIALPIDSGLLSELILCVPFCLYVYFYYRRTRHLPEIRPFIVLLLCVALLFAVSYFVHPEYAEKMFDFGYEYNILKSVFSPSSGIFAFLLIVSCPDFKAVKKSLYWAIWFAMAYNIARYAIATYRGYWNALDVEGNIVKRSYGLEFGYDMLFTGVLFLYFYLNRRRSIDLVPCAISVIFMLTAGGRGSLVYFTVGAIALLLCSYSRRGFKKPKARHIAFLFVLLLMSVAFFHQIISGISWLFESLGISSRSLNKLMSGSFLSDMNGRNGIYSDAIQLIEGSGPFGYGLYGDRYYLGEKYYWGFPHNILLEWCISFGVVIGTSLLIGLGIALVKTFLQHKFPFEERCLTLAFAIISMQLITSQSYWYCPSFWALLAMIYVLWRRKVCLNQPHEINTEK